VFSSSPQPRSVVMQKVPLLAWTLTSCSVWLALQLTPLNCRGGTTCPQSFPWKLVGGPSCSENGSVQPSLVRQPSSLYSIGRVNQNGLSLDTRDVCFVPSLLGVKGRVNNSSSDNDTDDQGVDSVLNPGRDVPLRRLISQTDVSHCDAISRPKTRPPP
jgi:hypothetical protein